MSGYFDPGAGGDLPAADQGTLDFLDAAKAASQRAAQAVQPTPMPEQDTNDYSPYGSTGSAGQDYGDQYPQGMASAGQRGYDAATPGYSSGVDNQPDQPPPFSSGIADEWGGNDPGQRAPSYSSGLDRTGPADEYGDRAGSGFYPPPPTRTGPADEYTSGIAADQGTPDFREVHGLPGMGDGFRYGSQTWGDQPIEASTSGIRQQVEDQRRGFYEGIDQTATDANGNAYQWDPTARAPGGITANITQVFGQPGQRLGDPGTEANYNPYLPGHAVQLLDTYFVNPDTGKRDQGIWKGYEQETRNYGYTQAVAPNIGQWYDRQAAERDRTYGNYQATRATNDLAVANAQRQAQADSYIDDLNRTQGEWGLSPQLTRERQAQHYADLQTYNQQQGYVTPEMQAGEDPASRRQRYEWVRTQEANRYQGLLEGYERAVFSGGVTNFAKDFGLTQPEYELVARAFGDDRARDAGLAQWLRMHDADPQTYGTTISPTGRNYSIADIAQGAGYGALGIASIPSTAAEQIDRATNRLVGRPEDAPGAATFLLNAINVPQTVFKYNAVDAALRTPEGQRSGTDALRIPYDPVYASIANPLERRRYIERYLAEHPGTDQALDIVTSLIDLPVFREGIPAAARGAGRVADRLGEMPRIETTGIGATNPARVESLPTLPSSTVEVPDVRPGSVVQPGGVAVPVRQGSGGLPDGGPADVRGGSLGTVPDRTQPVPPLATEARAAALAPRNGDAPAPLTATPETVTLGPPESPIQVRQQTVTLGDDAPVAAVEPPQAAVERAAAPRAGGVPSVEAPALAPRELPSGTLLAESPATNYTTPLANYTDRLYHQTSLDEALPFLDPNVSRGSIEARFATAPGAPDKGVTIELLPGNIEGQIDRRILGWRENWDGGQAEFTARRVTPNAVRESVQSITIGENATATGPVKARMNRVLTNLEGQGWTREAVEGGVRYTAPGVERVQASSITDTPAASLRPLQQATNDSGPIGSAIAEVQRRIESGAMAQVPSASSKYWQRFGLADGTEPIARLTDTGYIAPDRRGNLLALPPERRVAAAEPAIRAADVRAPGDFAAAIVATKDQGRATRAIRDLLLANYEGNVVHALPNLIGAKSLPAKLDPAVAEPLAEYLAHRITLPKNAALLDKLRESNPRLYRTLAQFEAAAPGETTPLLRRVQAASKGEALPARFGVAAPTRTPAELAQDVAAKRQRYYELQSAIDRVPAADWRTKRDLERRWATAKREYGEAEAALAQATAGPGADAAGGFSTAGFAAHTAPTLIGGGAGYLAPANSDEERWQHAAIGAAAGAGLTALYAAQPVMRPAFRKAVYGGEGALPGLGVGSKVWNTADTQRLIVSDRVNHGIYHALDGELTAKGIDPLDAASKASVYRELVRIIKDPTTVATVDVFKGTEGKQVAKFLVENKDRLIAEAKGIVRFASSHDEIADRMGIVAAEILKEAGPSGKVGVTPRDPLIAANQWIVQQLAPVWMTGNPRYHINNAASNITAELAQAILAPDNVQPGKGAVKAARQAAEGRTKGRTWGPGAAPEAAVQPGSGVRVSRYVKADLTGGPATTGGFIQRIAHKVTGGLAELPTKAANAVESNAKERVYFRNLSGNYAAAMKFETGTKGLSVGNLTTLFSDHWAGQTPKLTGLPEALKRELPQVYDAREATKLINGYVTSGAITRGEAGQAIRAVRTRLAEAEQYANYETSWALRDYRLRSRLDFALDHITPLHFWTTNNILATARLIGKVPATLPLVAAGVMWWMDQNDDLPDKFKRLVKLPVRAVADLLPAEQRDLLNTTIDNVYGKGADLYLRPWGWLNPAIGGALDFLNPDQQGAIHASLTRPQQITDLMEQMGYNPSPIWDAVGTALRRVGVNAAVLNPEPYFNPSLFGGWGTWARTAVEQQANDHPDNRVLALLRDVPYSVVNQAIYGERYSPAEHDAIARILADRERMGEISHTQALTALRDGEKNPTFMQARETYWNRQSGRAAVSWAGLPVSAQNDYQRERERVNGQYFADGATPEEKRATIDGNEWITTDWSRNKTPGEIDRQMALDGLWDQYNTARDKGDKKAAASIYAQIQQVEKTPVAASGQPTASPSAKPSASASAKPSAAPSASAKPLPATVGKGAVTATRAADVSSEFRSDQQNARWNELWDTYNALREADLKEKDKTGKNPNAAGKFFEANAAEMNRLDVHRTLKGDTQATTTTTGQAAAPATTPGIGGAGGATIVTTVPRGGIGAGASTASRAASPAYEARTSASEAQWDALWGEYDRLKATQGQAAASAFFAKNAAEFNRLDVKRTIGASSTSGSTATSGSGSASAAPKPTATATPRTATSTTTRMTATAPRTTTGAAPRTTSTSTARPAATSAPKASASYSSGIATLTEAQRTAKPFLGGSAAKAQGVFNVAQFQKELTAYTKGDLGGLDRATVLLDAYSNAGGNVQPYVQQVYRQNQATVATVIKAYQGSDRNQGQVQRAAWLRRMGALTPDLAGLKALRVLWREVLAARPKANGFPAKNGSLAVSVP